MDFKLLSFLILIILSVQISAQNFKSASNPASEIFQNKISQPERPNYRDGSEIKSNVFDTLYNILSAAGKYKNQNLNYNKIYVPLKVTEDEINRTIYTYSDKGFQLIKLKQHLESGTWIDVDKVTCTYDDKGNRLTYLFETYSEGSWKNSYRITNTYDNNSNELTNFSESWIDNRWLYTNKSFYNFNSNGNKETRLTEYWGTDTVLFSDRYTYSYDNNGNIIGEFQERNKKGAGWTNVGRYSHTYDINGKETVWMYETWSSHKNAWSNTSKGLTAYDNNGNLIQYLTLIYNNNDWTNNYLITYGYDADNNEVSRLNQSWADSMWINKSRTLSKYNSKGSQTSYSNETWEDTAWVWENKVELTYDDYGNSVKAENYYWAEGIWINAPGTIYLLYNNGSNNIYSYSSNVEVEYTSILPTNVSNDLQIKAFTLSQNYPNPFNPVTTFKFSLTKEGNTSLKVYDILGKEIRTLINEFKGKGEYKVEFNAGNLASGVYIYRLVQNDNMLSGRMILQK